MYLSSLTIFALLDKEEQLTYEEDTTSLRVDRLEFITTAYLLLYDEELYSVSDLQTFINENREKGYMNLRYYIENF